METQTIYSKALAPNSYEFGKAGNRFKIYFETPAELKAIIDELISLGLYQEEKL